MNLQYNFAKTYLSQVHFLSLFALTSLWQSVDYDVQRFC